MKIIMVNIEDGIISYGFRKISAFVEQLNKDTQTYFVNLSNDSRSISGHIFSKRDSRDISDETVDEISQGLTDADIIGFSSMSAYSEITKTIIQHVKSISKHPYIIWGGIHPIIYPKDAIQSLADAICTGEGEFAFREFYELFKNGKDIQHVNNFWFRKNGKIIRNGFMPLISSNQMKDLPFAKYGEDEIIYRIGRGFQPATLTDYLNSNGLSYNTLWTIGCPYLCTYCGNSKFITSDPKYKKIRYPDATYIINEVKQVIKKHRHVKSVTFNDDNFMHVKHKDILNFAQLWRKEINIPFVVLGIHPNSMDVEKLEILTCAGLNRVRMGIQSGSERILKFYKRYTPIEKILESAQKISSFSKYHIPPGYDIIVDNPIENRQDVLDSLELVYNLPRPFTLYIYSLKIIPNTELEKAFKETGLDLDKIDTSYYIINPTVANILLYLLTFYKPPRWLFDKLLNHVHASQTPQAKYYKLAFIMKLISGIKRGLAFLRFMDFSTIVGKSGYYLWWLGIIDFWNDHINAKMSKPHTNSINKQSRELNI